MEKAKALLGGAMALTQGQMRKLQHKKAARLSRGVPHRS